MGPIIFLIIFFSLFTIKVSGTPYAPNSIDVTPFLSDKIFE